MAQGRGGATVIVIVSDGRVGQGGRFPFPTRVDADKFMNAVRSRGLEAWFEEEAGQQATARPVSSEDPPQA